MNTQDYLPENVAFAIKEQDVMPLTLGEFESIEDVNSFIREQKIVVVNQSLKIDRLMDDFEKNEIRAQYINILEDVIPACKQTLYEKKSDLDHAKEEFKNAQETFSAYENQAYTLAKEVKRGLVEMKLTDVNTFRIPLKGKYYYYTHINKELKLCAIKDIPEHEQKDIFNSTNVNEQIFIDGEIETQARSEEQLLKVAQ